jgi:hypothetical protein
MTENNDGVVYFKDPLDIPEGWDDLAWDARLFNSVIFLRHLHLTNRVGQKYFFRNEAGRLALAGSLYRTVLPFRLGPACFGAPVSVCGVPMVYGSQAGFAPLKNVQESAQVMDNAWPGFQIIAGLEDRTEGIPGWSCKRYLITVDFNVRWKDFGGYVESMRSDYRKQVVGSLRKWQGVKKEITQGCGFNNDDYRMFLDMYKTAKDQSKPLGIDFFRNTPVEHQYIKSSYEDKNLGWCLLLPEGGTLHLLYLGYEITLNNRFDVYINLLLESIRYAIENGYKKLRMGQTAELIKMRLGGVPAERYILVRHTNPLVNQIIKRTDIFNFRKHYPPLRVFKSG